MTQFTDAYAFEGRTLIDRDGEKIGKIDEIYTDREGGGPEWALVHTGLFGTKKHFVPLAGATPSGEDVRANVRKDAVKDAPGDRRRRRAERGRRADALHALRRQLRR